MNGLIMITFFLILIGLAYAFVVCLPLFGIFCGVLKACKTREKDAFASYEDIVQCEILGFTMADGGERRKEKE
ncbi:MAG: hypothetical protein N2513_02045 [Deltaproteobacteria bacterium]|nr:hypothetical protein [Deltaproteobacteria bacterium]